MVSSRYLWSLGDVSNFSTPIKVSLIYVTEQQSQRAGLLKVFSLKVFSLLQMFFWVRFLVSLALFNACSKLAVSPIAQHHAELHHDARKNKPPNKKSACLLPIIL